MEWGDRGRRSGDKKKKCGIGFGRLGGIEGEGERRARTKGGRWVDCEVERKIMSKC